MNNFAAAGATNGFEWPIIDISSIRFPRFSRPGGPGLLTTSRVNDFELIDRPRRVGLGPQRRLKRALPHRNDDSSVLPSPGQACEEATRLSPVTSRPKIGPAATPRECPSDNTHGPASRSGGPLRQSASPNARGSVWSLKMAPPADIPIQAMVEGTRVRQSQLCGHGDTQILLSVRANTKLLGTDPFTGLGVLCDADQSAHSTQPAGVSARGSKQRLAQRSYCLAG